RRHTRFSRDWSSDVCSSDLRLAQNEKFFDDDYMQEVENAQKLVSDVNNQLSKEKVDWDDIKMPVQTNDRVKPDSIGNEVYTGDRSEERRVGKECRSRRRQAH